MNQGIDFTSIKNGLIRGFEYASEKAGQLYTAAGDLAGRAVTVIKAGINKALPYVQQDYRIAAATVVVANLVFIQLGEWFGSLSAKILPGRTDGQRTFRDIVNLTVGASIWAGGVAAFTRYANPALSTVWVVAISVGTIFARAVISA